MNYATVNSLKPIEIAITEASRALKDQDRVISSSEIVKQGHRRTRGKAAWQRRALVYGVAAVLVLMAIGVSGFVSPVMAAMLQKIPIIGGLYSFNGPKLNHYASDVNSSANDKGITVTVPKVYYDGRRLLLIYIIEVPEGYEPIYGSQINLATTKIQLNGKPLSFQSVVGMDSLVSTNMYRGDVGWDLSSDQAPQNSMLTIPIDQVGPVKGNWTLSVPISSTEVNKTIDTAFPQNASTTYDGITLTANKVSKGPVYTDVSMQLRQALQTDGKPISKMSLVELFGVPMNFNVLDTNHRFMNVAYFTDQHFKKVGNEKIWDFTIHFETPSSDVKAIVIEPILMVLYKEGVTEGNCPTIPQLAVTVPLN